MKSMIFAAAAACMLAFPAMAAGASCDQLPQIRQAADMGIAKAQIELSNMYFMGSCVRQDYRASFSLAMKAAQQGDAGAEFMVAAHYTAGLGVNQDVEKGTWWLWKSANHGEPHAQTMVGDLYRNGSQDYEEAMKWYLKAAEQGYAEAQNSYGHHPPSWDCPDR